MFNPGLTALLDLTHLLLDQWIVCSLQEPRYTGLPATHGRPRTQYFEFAC